MPVLELVLVLNLYSHSYLVIFVSACDDSWKYTLSVQFCGGGGSHCEVVVCSYTGSPWVNDTYSWFVEFNKARTF